MIRFGMSLAVCLSGLLVPTASDAKACVTIPFTFHLTSEGPWSAHGETPAGSRCTGGYTAGGAMTFKKLYLAERPQHGAISLREGGHFTYVATAGYSGADAFTLRVCGTQNGHDGCANILYSMTVTP